MVGISMPASPGSRSIRSHRRRATLGQSVAEWIVGLGRLWHPVQNSPRNLAPSDSGSGNDAAVTPGGGRATSAAAMTSRSLTPLVEAADWAGALPAAGSRWPHPASTRTQMAAQLQDTRALIICSPVVGSDHISRTEQH